MLRKTLPTIYARYGNYSTRQMKSIKLQSQKIRRSLLYVPGHDRRKIEKVAQLNADCVVLDCEDGVGYDQ